MAQAATRLRVTQPAVSKAIGELEAALGIRLFDRSTQGVQPTVYGEALLKCGMAAFDELRQGIRSIESLADPTSGEVRLGSPASLAGTIVAVATQRFAERYPRVIVCQDEVAFQSDQLSALRRRNYDLIVTRLVAPLAGEADDLEAEILMNDRMILTAGAHTRWARRRAIDLAELACEPWILSGPASWNYARFSEAFAARGLPLPKARVVSLSPHLRAHLAATGPYIVPFQRLAFELVDQHRHPLKILQVDLPVQQAPIAIVTLKNRTLTPVVMHFIEHTRQAASSFAKSIGGQ
jgi:DNA-binding transcriptional LysR family regulator